METKEMSLWNPSVGQSDLHSNWRREKAGEDMDYAAFHQSTTNKLFPILSPF